MYDMKKVTVSSEEHTRTHTGTVFPVEVSTFYTIYTTSDVVPVHVTFFVERETLLCVHRT